MAPKWDTARWHCWLRNVASTTGRSQNGLWHNDSTSTPHAFTCSSSSFWSTVGFLVASVMLNGPGSAAAKHPQTRTPSPCCTNMFSVPVGPVIQVQAHLFKELQSRSSVLWLRSLWQTSGLHVSLRERRRPPHTGTSLEFCLQDWRSSSPRFMSFMVALGSYRNLCLILILILLSWPLVLLRNVIRSLLCGSPGMSWVLEHFTNLGIRTELT